jgi:hypothetical protein
MLADEAKHGAGKRVKGVYSDGLVTGGGWSVITAMN